MALAFSVEGVVVSKCGDLIKFCNGGDEAVNICWGDPDIDVEEPQKLRLEAGKTTEIPAGGRQTLAMIVYQLMKKEEMRKGYEEVKEYPLFQSLVALSGITDIGERLEAMPDEIEGPGREFFCKIGEGLEVKLGDLNVSQLGSELRFEHTGEKGDIQVGWGCPRLDRDKLNDLKLTPGQVITTQIGDHQNIRVLSIQTCVEPTAEELQQLAEDTGLDDDDLQGANFLGLQIGKASFLIEPGV